MSSQRGRRFPQRRPNAVPASEMNFAHQRDANERIEQMARLSLLRAGVFVDDVQPPLPDTEEILQMFQGFLSNVADPSASHLSHGQQPSLSAPQFTMEDPLVELAVRFGRVEHPDQQRVFPPSRPSISSPSLSSIYRAAAPAPQAPPQAPPLAPCFPWQQPLEISQPFPLTDFTSEPLAIPAPSLSHPIDMQKNNRWAFSAAAAEGQDGLPGPPPDWLFARKKPLTGKPLCDTVVTNPSQSIRRDYSFPYKTSPCMVPLIPVVAASIALKADDQMLKISPILQDGHKVVRNITHAGVQLKRRGGCFMRHFELDGVLRYALNQVVASGGHPRQQQQTQQLQHRNGGMLEAPSVVESGASLSTMLARASSSSAWQPRALIELKGGATEQHSVAVMVNCARQLLRQFPLAQSSVQLCASIPFCSAPVGVSEWIEAAMDVFLLAHECEPGMKVYPPTRFAELQSNAGVKRDKVLAAIACCLTGLVVDCDDLLDVSQQVAPGTEAKWTLLFARLMDIYLPSLNGYVAPSHAAPTLICIDSDEFPYMSDIWRIARAAWMLRHIGSIPKGEQLLRRLMLVSPWVVSGVLAMMLLVGSPERHESTLHHGIADPLIAGGILPAGGISTLEQLLALRTVAVPGMLNTLPAAHCPRCIAVCLGDLARRMPESKGGTSPPHRPGHESEAAAFLCLWKQRVAQRH